MAAETYPGWSILVWKLFLELHFEVRSSCRNNNVVTKEPGNSTCGGITIRPRRSASLHALVKLDPKGFLG